MSEMFKLFQTLRLAPFGSLYLWCPENVFFFLIIIINIAITIITIILCDNDNNNTPFVSTHKL